MSHFSVEGADLAYDEAGSGDRLVLVHGTGAQASSWGRCVQDLARGHHVIAYDRRGYGRSVHPPVRDYRRHVADLESVLEQVGPAHVLGWSSGGSTALGLAARRPDLVTSLVIVEAPLHGLRNATPSLMGALLRAKAFQLRGQHRKGAEVFFRWASGLRDGGNSFDRLPAADRDVLLGNSRVVLAELDPHPYGVMFEHLPLRRVAALPMPVTWLLGERSREWYGRLHAPVAEIVPGLRTERIAGASHLMHAEQPVAFADAVGRALAAAA